jgi:thiol-disulfide isomerase/thioredoxin
MKTVNSILLFVTLTCLVAPSLSQEPPANKTDAVDYPILSGVGMALKISDGSVYIGMVEPDSVAGRSKAFSEGDQILSVQNDDKRVDVQGKRLGEIVSLIRGPVGSKVTLEVRPKKQDTSIKITLIREALKLEGRALTYREFIGRIPPDLGFARLDDFAAVKLSEHRGKILVLDFWATWCGACYQPVEHLQELARSHPEWKDRVELITVTVDTEREKASEVIQKKRWTQTTNLSVDPKALDAFGIQVIPVLLIISRDGTIATMAEAHAIDVEKEIQRLLALQDQYGGKGHGEVEANKH